MTYAEAIEEVVEETSLPEAQGWVSLEALKKAAEKLDGDKE